MRKQRIKIIATVGIAILGIGVIAASSVGDVNYYRYVDDVVKKHDDLLDKRAVKVHGYVAAGSLKTKIEGQTTLRTFELERNGASIMVRHRGTVPDSFKELGEAVATGKLVKEGDQLWLDAVDGETGIAAKCPSKHESR